MEYGAVVWVKGSAANALMLVSAARPAAAARAMDRIMGFSGFLLGFSLCLLTTTLDHRGNCKAMRVRAGLAGGPGVGSAVGALPGQRRKKTRIRR
jgi:hypothetical protein